MKAKFFFAFINLFFIFVEQESLSGSLVLVHTDTKVMSQINYYTEEGLKKLKDELYELTHVQRPSISNQIAEARDKGDLQGRCKEEFRTSNS